MKKIICLILASVLMLSLAACTSDKDKSADTTAASTTAAATDSAAKLDMVYAQIEMENGGTITLELDPNVAPITVANFKSLAESGFYNGLTFHRIYKGFMIQTGDPNGDGTGGSKQTIKGEFKQNGVNNTISHKRGVISMARTNLSMDSASSQFFICDADSTFLDGQYAAFGHVIDGLDVVDEIANTPVKANAQGEMSTPTVKVIMKEVRIIDAPDAATSAE